jgi:hypothetical protein
MGVHGARAIPLADSAAIDASQLNERWIAARAPDGRPERRQPPRHADRHARDLEILPATATSRGLSGLPRRSRPGV